MYDCIEGSPHCWPLKRRISHHYTGFPEPSLFGDDFRIRSFNIHSLFEFDDTEAQNIQIRKSLLFDTRKSTKNIQVGHFFQWALINVLWSTVDQKHQLNTKYWQLRSAAQVGWKYFPQILNLNFLHLSNRFVSLKQCWGMNDDYWTTMMIISCLCNNYGVWWMIMQQQ